MSPEIVKRGDNGYNECVDWWSLGNFVSMKELKYEKMCIGVIFFFPFNFNIALRLSHLMILIFFYFYKDK